MEEKEQEKPPAFRKWSHWYWLVMVMLVVEVVVFFYITRSFM